MSNASELLSRFDEDGVIEDLRLVIRRCQDTLQQTDLCSSGRYAALIVLSNSLRTQFDQQGDVQDLDSAIQYSEDALSVSSPHGDNRFAALVSLSWNLIRRFENKGDRGDLELAISHATESLELISAEQPERSSCLIVLAAALSLRFSQQGNTEDIESAVVHSTEALSIHSSGHPDHNRALDTLANALMLRLERSGAMCDLDKAIEYHTEALACRIPGHPLRSTSLYGLANALRKRFRVHGNKSDLDTAIAYHTEALQLRPPGHFLRSQSLNSLAAVLWFRYQCDGTSADLESCITYLSEEYTLRPPGHPFRFSALNGLAIALLCRWSERGDDADLELAIKYHTDALNSLPMGHPQKFGSLHNLAYSHGLRYTQYNVPEDLNRAVQYYGEAAELCPANHTLRPSLLMNLGALLVYLYQANGNSADLASAIEFLCCSMSIRSEGDPESPHSRKELAAALIVRATANNDLMDLQAAFFHLITAKEPLKKESGSYLVSIYRIMASAYGARYAFLGSVEDLDECFNYHKEATLHQASSVRLRLIASLQWIADARQARHKSQLDAYRVSLSLLGRLVIVAPAAQRRHELHRSTVPPSLACDAASCAIELGQLEAAVELLEQGRALMWAQLTRFRTSLDSLRTFSEAGRDLADKFERLSQQLEHGSFKPSASQEVEQYTAIAREWEAIVTEIRQIKEFSNFLRPTPFEELREAASQGPVIIVNISVHRCDAIVVLADSPLRLIPLKVTMDDITRLSMEFNDACKSLTGRGEEKRRGRQIAPVLRKLWDLIAHPVVDVLQEIVPRHSRIWWCPTSRLVSLPLHAAGSYRKEERNLPSFYVSSFTPTLSALIRSRRKREASAATRTMLAIGQSKPYNNEEDELQSVEEEIDLLRHLTSQTMSFGQINGPGGTRDAALQGLQSYNWIHLACHGKQDHVNPYESCFAMGDKPLRLADIIQARLADPEFAFLSACHTAMGDIDTPDEVIHLAAGLQFSGFRSVVGTIGAVDDGVVLAVVEQFYRHILALGGHYENAALALNHATRSLARRGVPLDQRIVFIHIGA